MYNGPGKYASDFSTRKAVKCYFYYVLCWCSLQIYAVSYVHREIKKKKDRITKICLILVMMVQENFGALLRKNNHNISSCFILLCLERKKKRGEENEQNSKMPGKSDSSIFCA